MSAFRVLDMTCSHCEKSIKQKLQQASPQVKVEVDLKDKIVKVENLADDQVLFLLKEIGFTPTLVK